MKPIFFTLLLAWVVVILGCNTMKGVGKDVQKVGNTIENAATK